MLADALSWAVAYAKPQCLIDIATLTGACEVALGKRAAGLFSTDDDLAELLLRNSRQRGERLWRLPLWEKSALEILKSPCADLQNSGIREGGAISAAVFLKQFTDGVSWAHIDMAGADSDESPVNAKGCTGFGVRILLDTVMDAQACPATRHHASI